MVIAPYEDYETIITAKYLGGDEWDTDELFGTDYECAEWDKVFNLIKGGEL